MTSRPARRRNRKESPAENGPNVGISRFASRSGRFLPDTFFEGAVRAVAFGGRIWHSSAGRRRWLSGNLKGCGCSSGVEHDLAKVGVEGSNPFARSRFSATGRSLTKARREGGLFVSVVIRKAGRNFSSDRIRHRRPRDALLCASGCDKLFWSGPPQFRLKSSSS
jgi:hypothetical protein